MNSFSLEKLGGTVDPMVATRPVKAPSAKKTTPEDMVTPPLVHVQIDAAPGGLSSVVKAAIFGGCVMILVALSGATYYLW